jgi:hypothetical protein
MTANRGLWGDKKNSTGCRCPKDFFRILRGKHTQNAAAVSFLLLPDVLPPGRGLVAAHDETMPPSLHTPTLQALGSRVNFVRATRLFPAVSRTREACPCFPHSRTNIRLRRIKVCPCHPCRVSYRFVRAPCAGVPPGLRSRCYSAEQAAPSSHSSQRASRSPEVLLTRLDTAWRKTPS